MTTEPFDIPVCPICGPDLSASEACSVCGAAVGVGVQVVDPGAHRTPRRPQEGRVQVVVEPVFVGDEPRARSVVVPDEGAYTPSGVPEHSFLAVEPVSSDGAPAKAAGVVA